MGKKQQMARIPKATLLESSLPVADLYQLASREGNAKKPVYEIHKWWARRLGTAFRSLLIAATSPAIPGETERHKAARLLSQFYQKRDLEGLVVLDPFMGGGTSVVEALKRGAHVIGVDIDPVAWFVTKKQVEPFNRDKFEAGFRAVATEVEAEIRELYTTWDPRSRRTGEIVNAFWVTRVTCSECRHRFDAHPHFQLGHNESAGRQDVFCQWCAAVHDLPLKQKSFTCVCCAGRTTVKRGRVSAGQYSCPSCGHKAPLRHQAPNRKPLPKRLFALEYTVPGDRDLKTGKPRRRLKRATEGDRWKYRKAASLLADMGSRLRYPRASIFRRGRHDLRPINYGYNRYHELFNARQLYCLARIYTAIAEVRDTEVREYLLLALSDCLAANNQLVGYAFGYKKATPLFGIHGYHIVQRPVEGNVWGNPNFGRASFTRCIEKLLLGKEYAGTPFEFAYSRDGEPIRVYCGESITTPVAVSPDHWNKEARALLLHRSSVDLRPLASKSVDLILTDPPFYNNLPYSELSDFYYQWLRPWISGDKKSAARVTPVMESLFVRRKNSADQERYIEGLSAVMKECVRVLKNDGLLAFTFHHKDPAAWHALGVALLEAGFHVTSVCPLRGEGVSGFHSYEGTPKWDAVICCRHELTDCSRAVASSMRARVRAVHRAEESWYRKLGRSNLVLSAADRASLAFGFSLQQGVNARDKAELGQLLIHIARKYFQKGVAPTIPGVLGPDIRSLTA